jgi:WD40 repeat protein
MDIDTRTDVYALGVILYELLTGSPPIDSKQFKRGAILEMLRMVREVDPPRPSTKLSTAENLPNIAANRDIEPAQLARALRGELDWVVMKALEKDRTRRYESAAEFAADVQRYLVGEAVQAVPPSAGYRLRKFMRRNRAAVLMAGAFAAVLLAATGVSLAFGLMATRAEGVAEQRRQDAEANETKAVQAGEQLRDARDELWANLYAARCTLISNAWEAKQFDLVRELLDKQIPTAGQRDHRGFEWHYLDRQLNAELLTATLPGGRMHNAAISPDGTLLVSVTSSVTESRLTAFDTTTGKEVYSNLLPGYATGRVSFSPDSRWIVLAMPVEKQGQAGWESVTVKVWDAATGAEVRAIRGLHSSTKAIAGPAGRFIAWSEMVKQGGTPASSTMRVRFLDPATGKELDSALKEIPDGDLQAVSPDGRFLATTVHKHDTVGVPVVVGKGVGWGPGAGLVPAPVMPLGTSELDVKVFEIATGKQLVSFQASDIKTVAFSPDSQRLLAAGKMLIVKDVATGDSVLEAQYSAAAAAFSPDGTRIAFLPPTQRSLPEGVDARIIDAATGRVRRVVQSPDGRMYHVGFSRDGVRLITAGSGRIKHWDAAADDRLAAMSYRDDFEAVGVGGGISPNVTRRARLASRGGPGVAAVVPGVPVNGRLPEEPALVWGRGDKPIFTSPPVPTGNTTTRLGFSPDDRLLLFRRTFGAEEQRQRSELRLWEIDTARELVKVVMEGRCERTAFSRDGRRLAALIEGDGRPLPRTPVTAPLALKAWDTDTGRELFTRPLGNGSRGTVALSPDGKRVTVLALDGERSIRLTVVDTDSGQEVVSASQPLPADWHWEGGASLVVSPRDARVAFRLVSAEEAMVRVWDPTSARLPVDVKGFSRWTGGLAFSPDCRRLAALGTNTLHLLDPDTGAELLRLTLAANGVTYPTDGTIQIGFTNMELAENEIRRLDGTPRPGTRQP